MAFRVMVVNIEFEYEPSRQLSPEWAETLLREAIEKLEVKSQKGDVIITVSDVSDVEDIDG